MEKYNQMDMRYIAKWKMYHINIMYQWKICPIYYSVMEI